MYHTITAPVLVSSSKIHTVQRKHRVIGLLVVCVCVFVPCTLGTGRRKKGKRKNERDRVLYEHSG